ncbi:MAG TPA: MFS transporter [Verrucomicrobiae bacterium]|nr:MFS transporter [Verrucomicrobiae bacterium]
MSSPNQTTSGFRNYRWVICALLFFSTTFNYLDRQVISYLKDYIFCVPLETNADFSTMTANDLDLHIFAGELNHSTNAISDYIKANLSPATLTALENYSGGSFPDETNLLENLNAMITNSTIYDPQRFAGMALRPETQKLLATNPTGTAVAHLNRLLLDDAFPAGIARGGFGWSNTDFSYLTTAFTLFYGCMTLLMGWVVDRIGTKLGLAFSLIFWSVCGIVNAFVGRLLAMHIFIRSAFAIGEAGNFPASVKTVAEWFPKRERAVATAVFNAGSNAGAMVAALFVPWCLIYFGNELGWKMAFVLTGAVGFFWLIFWFWLFEIPARQKRLSKVEYDYIHIDDEAAAKDANGDKAKISWWRLFGYRQGWAFFFGKFMTDGIWWFYLFWLPDYLKVQFNMSKAQIMMPTFIVYGVSIIGSIYGGSIPLTLVKRGMSVYKARMTAMFIIAVAPLAVLLTQYFGNVSQFGNMAATLAIAMIAIGATAHQAWSANLFTTVSDMYPKKAVASVIGIGTTAGAIGGSIVQLLAGTLEDHFKALGQIETAYFIMFIICALSYLIAWIVMKLLVPQHRPITDL